VAFLSFRTFAVKVILAAIPKKGSLSNQAGDPATLAQRAYHPYWNKAWKTYCRHWSGFCSIYL